MGEGELITGETVSKKGRHRKKQLYNSILQQMEFYFSESNLSKDRFLSQLIAEDPHIPIDTFLKFNKILKLTTSISDIQKAISKSEVIALSENQQNVFRKKPIKEKINVDECTIYVESIKSDATHDWLQSVFSEFGNVVYVSIPKYRHNKANKGFAFIEFETEKEAHNALEYFESIGSKMPFDRNPEELCSIATFEGDKDIASAKIKTDTTKTEEDNEELQEKNESSEQPNIKNVVKENFKIEVEGGQNVVGGVKRKLGDQQEEGIPEKKLKTEECNNENNGEQDENKKKKKTKKEVKKLNLIKEIGLQVLSKKEWKKMRNKYLDLQKKKMKEFKQYLYKSRFSQKSYDRTKRANNHMEESKPSEETPKVEFIPGVIVKLKLPEPCIDVKKLKSEIKVYASEVKYVDIPLPAGSEEVFLRFGDAKCAKDFCTTEYNGEKVLLENDEEKMYWDKIQNDRQIKFTKNVKKQRGRDKLLKKAENEMAKHVRFDEVEHL